MVGCLLNDHRMTNLSQAEFAPWMATGPLSGKVYVKRQVEVRAGVESGVRMKLATCHADLWPAGDRRADLELAGSQPAVLGGRQTPGVQQAAPGDTVGLWQSADGSQAHTALDPGPEPGDCLTGLPCSASSWLGQEIDPSSCSIHY